MYDLTVEEVHTFAVGDGDWVVHNCTKAGDGGSYADLVDNSETGDGIQIHHMPQNAAGILPTGEGGAIALPNREHYMTRTFGGRGRQTNIADANLTFTQRLQLDLLDVRRIANEVYSDSSHYDNGLQQVLDYYLESTDLLTRVDYDLLSDLLG